MSSKFECLREKLTTNQIKKLIECYSQKGFVVENKMDSHGITHVYDKDDESPLLSLGKEVYLLNPQSKRISEVKNIANLV